jgi:hypothetical protein
MTSRSSSRLGNDGTPSRSTTIGKRLVCGVMRLLISAVVLSLFLLASMFSLSHAVAALTAKTVVRDGTLKAKGSETTIATDSRATTFVMEDQVAGTTYSTALQKQRQRQSRSKSLEAEMSSYSSRMTGPRKALLLRFYSRVQAAPTLQMSLEVPVTLLFRQARSIA